MRLLGVPVLWIVAALSIIVFVALAVVSTQYPALVMNGNSANFWWIPAWFAGGVTRRAVCRRPGWLLTGARRSSAPDEQATTAVVCACRRWPRRAGTD